MTNLFSVILSFLLVASAFGSPLRSKDLVEKAQVEKAPSCDDCFTSVEQLEKAGYEVAVEGDASKESISELMSAGTLRIQKSNLGEESYDPDAPISDYAGKGGNDKVLERWDDDGGRRLQSQCLSVIDNGFANNGFISVRVEIAGNVSYVTLSCFEKCCARRWECGPGFCYLGCSLANQIVVSTFTGPGTSVCCVVGGRTIEPFPFGACADRKLCAA